MSSLSCMPTLMQPRSRHGRGGVPTWGAALVGRPGWAGGRGGLPARRGRGRVAPPIAVVSRALDLDLDGPLLADPTAGRARTIVLTTHAAAPERRAAAARHADIIVAGQDLVTAAGAIDALASRGFTRILAEGGPPLLRFTAAPPLRAELCRTSSPRVVGGDVGRIVVAPA